MGRRTKLLFVFGTRHEAVKLAPVIRAAIESPRFTVMLVSTAQHSPSLDSTIELFGLKLDYDLRIILPGLDPATLFSRLTHELTPLLHEERPDWVVVQGDSLSCLAGSLCAALCKIPVAHVEAGIRSSDAQNFWPEELVRKIASNAAQEHFAPTAEAGENLIREGISPDKVHITGNTGIDSQLIALDALHRHPTLEVRIHDKLPFLAHSGSDRKVVLLAVHRREGFGENLAYVLSAIAEIAKARPRDLIVFPVNPDPQIRALVAEILRDVSTWDLEEGLDTGRPVRLMEPLDYLSFLALMERCDLILTDSGAVQEEAPTLRKAVLVMNETTDRPEALVSGCARLIGYDPLHIIEETLRLLNDDAERMMLCQAPNPFGDGRAAHRVLRILDPMVDVSPMESSTSH